jgi:acyl-CoA hydrolase/GNAT superfamily N-acetyltransferase
MTEQVQAGAPARWLSAEDALSILRSGMRVFVGSGCAVPQKLVAALAARGPDVYDVEILHILTHGKAPYARRELLEHFRHNAFFIGPNVRDAVNAAIADYTPIFLSEVPELFYQKRLHLDVALVQVSPPDAHGQCSLGVSVDVVKAAVRSARHVIAEVNPLMPRTLGESSVHVSELHTLVASDLPLIEHTCATPSAESCRIGEYIASLVEDGATLQTGIGEIPSAVLAALTDKKDLGMHTEMFTEAVIPLIESGILNGARKTLHPGKVVASFCFGNRRLYDYIHENPRFAFYPTEIANDPWQIAQNRQMVAISSALEVDLTGQVCADSIGDRFYSGFGGQVDFMRGAARSDGGKPIIALPATAKGGTLSRIVPSLRPGAGVVTTRADVHYVVTEFGIAYLHGKTVRERTLALINIAHPKFRDELLQAARERHLVHPNQIALPPNTAPYPRQYESNHQFSHQLAVHFRPVKPTDEVLLKELFYSHSPETILHRYFTPLRHLTHEQVQRFVTLDYTNDMALLALIPFEGRERAIAVGRYYRTRHTDDAEVAITVQDEYQHHGLGIYLLRHLSRIAKEHGVTAFTADVLADNHAMMELFRKFDPDLETRLEDGIYHVRIALKQ